MTRSLMVSLAALALSWVTGCGGEPVTALQRVVTDERAMARDFKALLEANGVLAKVNEEFDCDNYVIKSVKTVNDGNGLVQVVIERPPFDDPSRSSWFRNILFLFDREGHLLSWSSEVSGTWQLVDVTGDSQPDLLVTDGGHVGESIEERARSYYHLFQPALKGDRGLLFAKGPVNGLTYPIQVLKVAGSRLPLVLTVDPGLPVADESADWRTVIRCFKDGKPQVVLVVSGDDWVSDVYDGGLVLIKGGEDETYRLKFDPDLREFKPDLLFVDEKKAKNPIVYSAKVPG